MKDDLLRRMAEIEKARRAPPGSMEGSVPECASWYGRHLLDPGGQRIGVVSRIVLDGIGGGWLEVAREFGVLDWLNGMGAGKTRLVFHSEDVTPSGQRDLLLKKSVVEPGSKAG